MESEPKTTVGASLGATINLGNYESQKMDAWITGVPVDATDEQLALLLSKANITVEKVIMALAEELNQRIADIRGQ